MKVGDRLICRKTNIFEGICYYIKGKEYTILNISTHGVFITVSSECGPYEMHKMWLFEESPRFYTIKEMRKQKLERISNV